MGASSRGNSAQLQFPNWFLVLCAVSRIHPLALPRSIQHAAMSKTCRKVEFYWRVLLGTHSM